MSKFDFTKPLEAVCKETGKVVPLKFARQSQYTPGRFYTTTAPCRNTSNGVWDGDGSNACAHKKWTIRNVPETPSKTFDFTKPATLDGQPVEITEGNNGLRAHILSGVVHDSRGNSYAAPCHFLYRKDGTHRYGIMPDLQNVAEVLNLKEGDRVVADNGQTGTVLPLLERAKGCKLAVEWDRYDWPGGSNNCFKADGTQWNNRPRPGAAKWIRPALVAAAPEPAPLDWSKPLELSDGTPVQLEVKPGFDGDPQGAVRVPSTHHNRKWAGSVRYFNADGTRRAVHINPEITLRNRKEPTPMTATTLDLTKPLQTRSGNKRVSLIGKLEDGRLVVDISYGALGGETKVIPANGRLNSRPSIESADDIINVPVVRETVYRNVYADGSVGLTKHKARDNAKHGSKYGKVRVAILKQVFEDGKLVDAISLSTFAQRRTPTAVYHGAAAWA